MSNIDERIVRMDFQNSSFERAVAVTLSTLDKLKNSLHFSQQKNGLDDLEASSKKLTLKDIGDKIDNISNRWSLMRIAGITAFTNIVNKAVDSGIRITKAFTIDPIKAGFQNYETQINAVQTILANTGLKGAAGLGQVNAALAELNTYANQTVYNFSEMARNIGTFTAAGVDLKTSTASIKGIANLAALSGSTSEQASTAMYQLSQAIAANKVGLQDWNSVVNAGLGGKVFQQALFNTGQALHTIKSANVGETFDQWTKSGHSFRNSLQDGWITGKVLTQTLQGFTGDLTAAQLKSMGYNDAQIKQIREMGTTATKAATNIKTLSQLQDALKEEVATAYGAIFKTMFGDINGATELFSGLHNVLENALTGPIYKLNDLLEGANKLGARKDIIQAFKNVFVGFDSILNPIKAAFRDIFPAVTAKQIATFAHQLENFTETFRLSKTAGEELRRTFRGIFAVFDIGKQIVEQVFDILERLFFTLTSGSGSVLKVTANIGDFLVALDKAIKNGYGWLVFWNKLGTAIMIPFLVLKTIRNFIIGLFDGYHSDDAENFEKNMTGINKALHQLFSFGNGVSQFFGKLGQQIRPALHAISEAFSGVGHAIAQAFTGTNLQSTLGIINTALLGGIAFFIRRFFKKPISIDAGGGLIGSIKESFEGLTGVMKGVQQQLKANTLLKIGEAIALLTLSVVALSLIDASRLQTSLKALAVGFGELLASMSILTKISSGAGLVKIPAMAAGLILMSGAILILTGAVKVLSTMSWDELKRGLGGLAILLATITVATKVLSANSAGLISAGVGITILATGINVLLLAVLGFSRLSYSQLEKGLAGVAGALLAIALAMRVMPRGMVLQAAALILISTALNAVYFAVKAFATLDWKSMARGLVGVAGALAAIAIGMQLMPQGLVLQAAGLIVIAAALQLVVRAVGNLGQMSWSTIGRGLAGLAGALAIIAGGMYLMTGALPGAAALLIVSGALAIFVPVLKVLGSMSWGNIAKGLAALAGALAVIGIAGLLLTPVIPSLLGLGVAVGLLGAGLALAGVGALAFATAFGLVVGLGAAGIKVLIDGFTGLISVLPLVGLNLALLITNFVGTLAEKAPAIAKSIFALLSTILVALPTILPQLGTALTALIDFLVSQVYLNSPKLIAAGFALLLNLLSGLNSNIVQITNEVADIVVKMIGALSSHAGALVSAGLALLIHILSGISKGAGNIAVAALGVVGSFIAGLGRGAGRLVGAAGSMIGSIIVGIGNAAGRIISAGVTTILHFLSGAASQTNRLVSGGFTIMINFINSLANTIRQQEPVLIQAFVNLGSAIIGGLGQGIENSFGGMVSNLKNKMGGMVGSVKSFLGIKSPSRVFAAIGAFMMQGMGLGIKANKDMETNLQTKLLSAYKNANRTVAKFNPLHDLDINTNPVIRPVLDLSDIEANASKINNLVNGNGKILAQTSTSSAGDIYSQRAAAILQAEAQRAADAAAKANSGNTYNYNQTNNSPTALGTAEIYRQSKSLFTMVKGAIEP